MTLNEKWMPSPHYSTSRGPYNKIVFHTTEGAMTIESLGSWFQNPSAGCSSHHGADNTSAGLLGAYVQEQHKAWTQGNANPYCLSLEMCAYASWSSSTWLNSKNVLLNNAADWLREMQKKYNVPWTVLSNAQAQDPNARGICQHVNLGSWGSGHVDCGSGFPLSEVIKRAKGSSGTAPAPTEEDMTPGSALDSQGRVHLVHVGTNHNIYYQGPGNPNATTWYNVDPGAYAKGGVDISVHSAGDDKLVITYANKEGAVCTYAKPLSGGPWVWANRGGMSL